METVTLKVRISVLWIFMAVAMYRCTSFLDPGVIEGILAGEAAEWQSPGMLLFVALCWLIPLTMAFLSVTLRNAANRWANIILGIVFTVLNIYHLTIHLAEPTDHGLLIVGSTIVVTALIACYAWKWPTQEA